uniref:Uncharacterized protein n=1 Tax=Panagrolaimus davidi TaxID=227884 RepID=A0A914PXP9_9BILA
MNELKNQKDFVAKYRERFFIFTFMLKDAEDGKLENEFFITIEYSPSELAVIKVVNCKWNCKLMKSNESVVNERLVGDKFTKG